MPGRAHWAPGAALPECLPLILAAWSQQLLDVTRGANKTDQDAFCVSQALRTQQTLWQIGPTAPVTFTPSLLAVASSRAESHALCTQLQADDQVQPAPLQPGDISVHNERVMHGSGPNLSQVCSAGCVSPCIMFSLLRYKRDTLRQVLQSVISKSDWEDVHVLHLVLSALTSGSTTECLIRMLWRPLSATWLCHVVSEIRVFGGRIGAWAMCWHSESLHAWLRRGQQASHTHTMMWHPGMPSISMALLPCNKHNNEACCMLSSVLWKVCCPA